MAPPVAPRGLPGGGATGQAGEQRGGRSRGAADAGGLAGKAKLTSRSGRGRWAPPPRPRDPSPGGPGTWKSAGAARPRPLRPGCSRRDSAGRRGRGDPRPVLPCRWGPPAARDRPAPAAAASAAAQGGARPLLPGPEATAGSPHPLRSPVGTPAEPVPGSAPTTGSVPKRATPEPTPPGPQPPVARPRPRPRPCLPRRGGRRRRRRPLSGAERLERPGRARRGDPSRLLAAARRRRWSLVPVRARGPPGATCVQRRKATERFKVRSRAERRRGWGGGAARPDPAPDPAPPLRAPPRLTPGGRGRLGRRRGSGRRRPRGGRPGGSAPRALRPPAPLPPRPTEAAGARGWRRGGGPSRGGSGKRRRPPLGQRPELQHAKERAGRPRRGWSC